MSIELHPDINNLSPDSLCYSIYTQLYQNFFNAQDKGMVTEGDAISIRLHNTAYGFAEAISGAVAGEGGNTSGGVLLDYLKKSGGDMSGHFRANYGFEAGAGNRAVLNTYHRDKEYGVEIEGTLRLGGENLLLDGKPVLSYNGLTQTVTLSSSRIAFGNAVVSSTGEWVIGTDKKSGICFSPSTLTVQGNLVFHAGNANLESVNWRMKSAIVKGNLTVAGKSELTDTLTALYGVSLGISGSTVLSVQKEEVFVKGWMRLADGYGIRLNNTPVLSVVNKKDLELAVPGGDLLLGSDGTNKILLSSGLMDSKGSYMLLSRYGAAYFPESLTVRHNYGNELLSSYRENAWDEGMILHKRLRFGSKEGAYLSEKAEGIALHSSIGYIDPTTQLQKKYLYEHDFIVRSSTSVYKPLNRPSHTFSICTETDFISFDKPVEAKSSIGIENSYTCLTDRKLLLSDEHYLLSTTDGIKHSGNAYFLSGISSERFSSGFAGSGWAIYPNKASGSVVATFDELTIRKKMRIYEQEVQKINVTNGSLWVSDHCQGDSVIKL